MIAYVLLGLAAATAVSADCTIDMNSDLAKHKSPLWIKDSELLLPTPQGKTGVLTLDSGESVTLACPGSKNSLTAADSPVVSATCSSGASLLVNGEVSKVEDLACSKVASSSLTVTDKTCEQGGTVLELGFMVKNDWFKMAELCHQVEKGNTLYAIHTISGAALAGAEVESKRPSFTRGDSKLFKGSDPNKLYKQSTCNAMLQKALGKTKADQLTGSTFIARGHLAPDADFIFGSWQFLTYYYANVAPQWQSINAGNWLDVEKNVRSLASQLGRDLKVITGTQGVLTTAHGTTGRPVELYLDMDKKQVPIPENFWKLVYDEQTGRAIVIVSSNNPLEGSAPICSDICAANQWPAAQGQCKANDKPAYATVAKGQIYCCSVEDFRKAVPYVPELNVSGVLPGPTAAC